MAWPRCGGPAARAPSGGAARARARHPDPGALSIGGAPPRALRRRDRARHRALTSEVDEGGRVRSVSRAPQRGPVPPGSPADAGNRKHTFCAGRSVWHRATARAVRSRRWPRAGGLAAEGVHPIALWAPRDLHTRELEVLGGVPCAAAVWGPLADQLDRPGRLTASRRPRSMRSCRAASSGRARSPGPRPRGPRPAARCPPAPPTTAATGRSSSGLACIRAPRCRPGPQNVPDNAHGVLGPRAESPGATAPSALPPARRSGAQVGTVAQSGDDAPGAGAAELFRSEACADRPSCSAGAPSVSFSCADVRCDVMETVRARHDVGQTVRFM